MTTALDRMLTEAEKREALRNGVDVRPGRMVTVEIVSRATGAHAGVVVQVGTHRYEVHELDVPSLKSHVETDRDHLAAARRHFETEQKEFLAAKGKGLPRPSLEASFQTVSKRPIQPFDSVRVVSGEKPEKEKSGSKES